MAYLKIRVQCTKKDTVLSVGNALSTVLEEHDGWLFWDGAKYNSHTDTWYTDFTMLHASYAALVHLSNEVRIFLNER